MSNVLCDHMGEFPWVLVSVSGGQGGVYASGSASFLNAAGELRAWLVGGHRVTSLLGWCYLGFGLRLPSAGSKGA